jgi:hypothetical protein
MEIQTFFLCERITRHPDNRHDVERAGIAFFECTSQTPWPFQFTLPALILLRRESDRGHAPFRLRFDLVDEDGRAAGKPRQVVNEFNFPDGARFFCLTTVLPFEFPRPGRYRLDVVVDDGFSVHTYPYNIDFLLRKGS